MTYEKINTDFVTNLLDMVDHIANMENKTCIIFHDEKWFGITCIDDGAVFKISLKDALKSISNSEISDGTQHLWKCALFGSSEYRMALTNALQSKAEKLNASEVIEQASLV